ncbi:MAG: MotA/TolQ/ExbB proton channel family protein [Verrucomicrobia bacterium]|nr:MotA/TolQ/ExbB proton channel family protein [Verrucomicrobiota bacterium]
MKYFLGPLLDWNLIVVILIGCSVLAVAIFIERLLYLRRTEVDSTSFLIKMRQTLQEGNIVAAVSLCEKEGGATPNIIRAGLLKHEKGRSDIEGAMELQGTIEIANLEKNGKILSIIAHIAPLVGLLGTVLGFIQAFSEMRQTGLMDISTSGIGGAMEYALVTTAGGLVVAIPAIVAYNYLVSRIGSIVLDMKTTSSEVIDLLIDHAI